MEILRIRHSWPEAANFDLNRPKGTEDYVLLHFHNSVQLFFDGQWHETAPGALILFSPGQNHRFISREPLLHDWMHAVGRVEEEIAPYGLKANTLYQPERPAEITELFARLEAECFARRSYSSFLINALLTEMWVLLARGLMGDMPLPVPRETAERLRSLRAEMLLHPEYPWSNEEMAARIGLSVSRLYPLYRRMFSLSPGKDLILMRVEKAKNMLLQGESVSRAAEQTGYNNPYHFIRQFKQIVGMTPGKIRK